MIKQISIVKINKDKNGNEWEMVVIYDDGSTKANIKTLDDINITLQVFEKDREFIESQVNI